MVDRTQSGDAGAIDGGHDLLLPLRKVALLDQKVLMYKRMTCKLFCARRERRKLVSGVSDVQFKFKNSMEVDYDGNPDKFSSRFHSKAGYEVTPRSDKRFCCNHWQMPPMLRKGKAKRGD